MQLSLMSETYLTEHSQGKQSKPLCGVKDLYVCNYVQVHYH